MKKIWYICAAIALLAPAARAADLAAAFLENGLGPRGVGMGSAYIAVVDDASAPYWNPAGLVHGKGKDLLAAIQPMSLDRQQNSVSLRLNLRGELGLGFTWLHAGVDHIVGRTSDGRPTGAIEDAANALYFAVSRALGQRAAIGLALKTLNHQIKAPSSGTSEGKGSGFDLGLQYYLNDKTTLAFIVRNFNAALDWKVQRSSDQSSSTEDSLPLTTGLGLAHRPFAALQLALDLYNNDIDRYANLGAEWQLNPMFIARAGLHRVGGEDGGLGLPTAGLTLRPMRRQTVQFHYTYSSDPLSGGRTSVGLTVAL